MQNLFPGFMQTLVHCKKVCDENQRNKQRKIKMTGASDKLIREK